MEENKVTFVRNLEIIVVFISFIFLVDGFNNMVIINRVLVNANINDLFYKLRVINLVLITLIAAISFFNLYRYNILKVYLLPFFMSIALIIAMNQFFSYDINEKNSIIGMFFIIVGILCDYIYYYDITFQEKKKLIFTFLFILAASFLNIIFFRKSISIYYVVSVVLIYALILLSYKNIQREEKNYSFLVGSIAIFELLIIIEYSSFINERYFYLIYSLYKFLVYIFLFIGIFYFNYKKSQITITERENQVRLYANKMNKIVRNRINQIEIMNKRLDEDLEYARKIQQSLLPVRHLKFNDVVFYSNYYACEKLSGDFYDIFRIDNKHIGMYLLDVSGHGVSAAMMTMFGKNSIISGERLIRRYRGLKPHRNLEHFFDVFNRADFPPETHMVILFASYNTDTKVLKYSSGGMNCNPIVIPKNGKIYELSENEGFPISKVAEFYTPTYTSSSTILDEGDMVLFYTDGLTDYNKNKVLDHKKLIELLEEGHSSKSLSEILSKKIDERNNNLEDDITYFIMQI